MKFPRYLQQIFGPRKMPSVLSVFHPGKEATGSSFKGRRGELSQLHEKTARNKQLIVHGATGTGKTSLVKHGLPEALHIICSGGDDKDALLRNLRKGLDLPYQKAPTLDETAEAMMR